MQEFINTLYTEDNLFILTGLNSNLVDLIYLDPPFNSKRIYSAPIGSKAAGSSFKDMWTWEDVNVAYLNTLAENYPALTDFIAATGVMHSKAMAAYLTYMAQRIIEMHRVLKDTGCLYLHCDPTASHYLKVVLDEIFGKDNFRNEIIWHYKTTLKASSSHLGRDHDVILCYAKSNLHQIHPDRTDYPASENTLKRWGKYADTEGFVSNKHFAGSSSTIIDTSDDEKGFNINYGIPRDVWYIPHLTGSSKEKTGYPTQKPLALLHRIIKASSNEGDIVLDPFCGCATTCVAAQQLGRKWIGIDIEKQAADILVERLSDDAGLFKNFVHTAIIPQRTDIQKVEPTKSVKERLYKEQNGLCNACGTAFDIWNLEIDHIRPRSKGGGDCYENYQLLCSHCNKMKSANPMESLRLKIETRKKLLKEKITFGE
ncbi:DNA methyltransferase [Candidatus Symbiothrix dinenymphae]|uniref:DNA methyltransferase n=1 Tax=Candidatus Symbiothrix dinenymphae TaxID=467085 RepID=UPI0006BFB4F4|nr:DNA methyltransferase [Candidatus Symbiothrix dinenymphae]GAP71547.1 type III restriction-modification system methylation subunit [Candidatus Symbiothrix dinenymphae]